ncbi:DUF6992 family protein [Mariniphaga sp.]|uniref:DUF6992 family protein n=1 Tax=Mariniphaga sp. TaxID=1954475 RepID=UPI003566F687
MKRWILSGIFSILIFSAAHGQGDYKTFYERSLKTNNTGMYILGSWAVANMVAGGWGWSQTTGQTKYFHQMNFFWNTVNLSIAGIALYSNLNASFSDFSTMEIMEKHTKTENLYLINAGLDVLYIGTGFLLKHLATKKPNRHDLLKGYGNSVILQGSFLFIFDLVLWKIQYDHRLNFIQNLSFNYLPEMSGFQLALTIPVN